MSELVDLLREAAEAIRAEWAPARAGSVQRYQLAVADWLDDEARNEAYSLAEFGHRSARPEALAVARAYLGRDL